MNGDFVTLIDMEGDPLRLRISEIVAVGVNRDYDEPALMIEMRSTPESNWHVAYNETNAARLDFPMSGEATLTAAAPTKKPSSIWDR